VSFCSNCRASTLKALTALDGVGFVFICFCSECLHPSLQM